MTCSQTLRWSGKRPGPNQLRHACASRLAADLGVETALAVLGHSDAGVTASVYVERDLKKAFEVMRELG